MKTITMDYETYEEELACESIAGIAMGVSGVMHFLESGKPFYEWYYENRCREHAEIPGNWERILRALGRESEMNPS